VQDIAQGLAGMQTPCEGGHPVQWDADGYAYVECDSTHYILQHPDYLNGQPFSPCMEYGGMPYDMAEHVLEAELPPPAIVPDYQTWRVQDIAQGLAGMQTPCMGGHPVQWDADDYVYVVCDGNTHYTLQHPGYLNGQPFSPCMEYGGMPYNMTEHVLQ